VVAVSCALLLPTAAVGAAASCPADAREPARCAQPEALPAAVGPAPAAPSPEPAVDIPLPSPQTLFGLICVLGGLFALIGLMPDFDGWGGEQEGRRRPD
jgi:hypothetical protein